MKNINKYPKPLITKIIFTPLIGAGCLVFGIAYHCLMRDSYIMSLSIIILLMSLYKGYTYYKIAESENYEIIEGTCIGVATKLTRKFHNIRFMDDAGIEATVRVRKNNRFIIGEKYRLYFAITPSVNIIGGEYLTTRLATDNFLGYERI